MTPHSPAPLNFLGAPRLHRVVANAVARVVTQFAPAQLHAEQVAVTLVDLSDANQPAWGSYRGTTPFYPASVVKSFYLAAAHRWLEDGRLAETEELHRALRDMIVDSRNEATGYVVDLLTETTSGPELPPPEFAAWWEKRHAVNRYFAGLGYVGINLNRKTWCEGPYGREQQATQLAAPDDRNWLTTDATARLFAEFVSGRSVSPDRSRQMLALHERQPFDPEGNVQSREYIGAALPTGAKLWSKAGWTREVRHDAAYVELPTGERFVLVIFTTGHSKEQAIIPALAREIMAEMQAA